MRNLQINQSITNASALLERYFHEISKEEMCTAAEEIELAQKVRNGDRNALNKLTKSNLRFVVSVAKKYQHQGLALPDLISEGNLGLIKAAYRFDETRGFKFISFAVWWIRQSIIAAITEHARMIRLPLNKIQEITKINRAVSEMEQQLQRQPATEQVAGYLRMDAGKLNGILQVAIWTTSLDVTLNSDDYTLLDKIHSPDFRTDALFIAEADSIELKQLLRKLSERERKLIELSYGLCGQCPMTPAEIAPMLGLSTERVRQLKMLPLIIFVNL